jgi:hypothetical protein
MLPFLPTGFLSWVRFPLFHPAPLLLVNTGLAPFHPDAIAQLQQQQQQQQPDLVGSMRSAAWRVSEPGAAVPKKTKIVLCLEEVVESHQYDRAGGGGDTVWARLED